MKDSLPCSKHRVRHLTRVSLLTRELICYNIPLSLTGVLSENLTVGLNAVYFHVTREREIFLLFPHLCCFVLFLSQNGGFKKNDPDNFLLRVSILLPDLLIYLIYLKFDCSEHP